MEVKHSTNCKEQSTNQLKMPLGHYDLSEGFCGRPFLTVQESFVQCLVFLTHTYSSVFGNLNMLVSLANQLHVFVNVEVTTVFLIQRKL